MQNILFTLAAATTKNFNASILTTNILKKKLENQALFFYDP